MIWKGLNFYSKWILCLWDLHMLPHILPVPNRLNPLRNLPTRSWTEQAYLADSRLWCRSFLKSVSICYLTGPPLGPLLRSIPLGIASLEQLSPPLGLVCPRLWDDLDLSEICVILCTPVDHQKHATDRSVMNENIWMCRPFSHYGLCSWLQKPLETIRSW